MAYCSITLIGQLCNVHHGNCGSISRGTRAGPPFNSRLFVFFESCWHVRIVFLSVLSSRLQIFGEVRRTHLKFPTLSSSASNYGVLRHRELSCPVRISLCREIASTPTIISFGNDLWYLFTMCIFIEHYQAQP